MKITEFGTIKSVANLRRRGKAAETSGSFADFLVGGADDAPPAAQLSDVTLASPVGNMLALQEISEEEVSRKKLLQKGKNLLDELDTLRQQLLIGNVPLSTLQALNRQLSVQRQSISDPHLLAILDDIELRAAVELAKLEMAAAAQSSLPITDE